MNESEKNIQNFGDMVNATEKLTKPWRIALIVTNALWAAALIVFILLAYLIPDTSYQMQDFDEKIQSQSVGTEVVTVGD